MSLFDEIIRSNFSTFVTESGSHRYFAMSYTEEVLGNLNKRELTGMVIPLQGKETKKHDLILEEIRKLNDKFSQFESENAVIKQADSLLSKRLVDIERQCWANAQYSRRECIEMMGISNSVKNNELEDKVLPVFTKLDVNFLLATLTHVINSGKTVTG